MFVKTWGHAIWQFLFLELPYGVLEETARVFEEKPRHIQPTLFTSVENGTESSVIAPAVSSPGRTC